MRIGFKPYHKKFKSQPIVIGYNAIVKFFFTIFLPHYLSSFTISREFLHLVQLGPDTSQLILSELGELGEFLAYGAVFQVNAVVEKHG
jgi:hypothetical protein